MCAERTSNNSTSQHGLIILGNTGVGKSFIANVVLGRDAFENECRAGSVTHETEFQDYAVGDATFAVFNVPGLIEDNQAALDRNKVEIYKAFQQRPNSVVVFVFTGGSGGRIRDEDVIAFKAINAVYHFQPQSLLLIVNDLPVKRPSKYEGETSMKLERLLEMADIRVCFLDRINKTELGSGERIGPTNAKANYNSGEKKHVAEHVEENLCSTPELDEREIMRRKLLNAIMYCTPHTHEKHGDIQLTVDKMKILIEESKKIQQGYEQERAKKQAEIDQRQQQYDEYRQQQKVRPHEVHHHDTQVTEQQAGSGDFLQSLLGLIVPISNILRLF